MVATFITETLGYPTVSNKQAKACAKVAIEFAIDKFEGIKNCGRNVYQQAIKDEIAELQKQLSEL